MLKIDCDKCHKELDLPGAVVIGPPDEDNNCVKWHLCIWCYDDFLQLLDINNMK